MIFSYSLNGLGIPFWVWVQHVSGGQVSRAPKQNKQALIYSVKAFTAHTHTQELRPKIQIFSTSSFHETGERWGFCWWVSAQEVAAPDLRPLHEYADMPRRTVTRLFFIVFRWDLRKLMLRHLCFQWIRTDQYESMNWGENQSRAVQPVRVYLVSEVCKAAAEPRQGS